MLLMGMGLAALEYKLESKQIGKKSAPEGALFLKGRHWLHVAAKFADGLNRL
jgi:hypothetical protein